MVLGTGNDIFLDIIAGGESVPDLPADSVPLRYALDSSRLFIDGLIEGFFPMVIAGVDGAIIRINGLFTEKYGLTGGDVMGKQLGDLFTRQDGTAPVHIHTEEGKRWEHEALLRSKAGSDSLVKLKCVNSIHMEGGHVTVCSVEDTTETERMYLRFQKLFLAVEQSPASVVITDVNGTIEYVNPKFTQLTGYTPDEALGKNPRILKSGEQPAEYYASMWNDLLSGNEWRGEFHNIKKTGESYWELASISPIKDYRGNITHFIAVKEDITARKNAEAEREAALEALRVREEDLRKKNRIMERELAYAQVIIRMLLPSESPRLPWITSEFRYIPLDEVGGDFFSFLPLGGEGGLGVFIGDVAGHGVSAALFLAMIKSITERLHRDASLGPAEYLGKLNRELIENMHSYFVTAVYGQFSIIEGALRFVFAKAGHPPPLVWRKETGQVEVLKSRGSILGYFAEQEYENLEVRLGPGDRVFLYTDGIIETEDPEQRLLGLNGFSRLIQANAGSGIAGLMDGVIEGLDRFRGKAQRNDDIVLLGFEINSF